ncbi:galactose-specific lectin nattectin-like isoform X2 [Stigmatopora nigra]
MRFFLHFLLLLCGPSGLLTGTAFVLYKDQECPPDWTRLNSRCIIFINERLRFSLAETFCNLLGGNLVSISNALENEVVRQVIRAKAGSFDRAWIGLHDRVMDGTFLWVDGSNFGFEDWASGRPRVGTNQDCTEINFQGETWNDQRCGRQRPFVCAKYVKSY